MKYILSFLVVLTFTGQHFFAQEVGFEFVNPPMTIVVLGSSTAAGAGARPIENSWVNKFREYVRGFNPNNQVINLAKGGYNTYKLMPTDSIYPSRRPQPDTLRNFTKAFEHNPDGIIVNLPSNDISSGYTVEEQLSNFRRYAAISAENNVELWVTTTQPRNFPRERDRQLQEDVKDSLEKMFPSKCIDFWTGFSDADKRVEKTLDSGDGCHLNNDGHQMLTDRVIESQAFHLKLMKTSFQKAVDVDQQEELSPHMVHIGFKGAIDFDTTFSEVSRFVMITQEGRTIEAVEVEDGGYEIEAIINLRHPVNVEFIAPNSLTKTIEIDFGETTNNANFPSTFYPIESLDILEVQSDEFTYSFPNNSICIAQFTYDESLLGVRFDNAFTEHQRQRIEDAMITPPSEGNKLVTYWENGTKKSVLKFKNGQLHRKAKWYRKDGTKKRVVTFKNGAYSGKFVTFNLKGKKQSMRTFEDDKQVGETKLYD